LLLEGRIQFGTLLRQSTAINAIQFLFHSFLERSAPIWKALLSHQSI
jgi:hypothetical protein